MASHKINRSKKSTVISEFFKKEQMADDSLQDFQENKKCLKKVKPPAKQVKRQPRKQKTKLKGQKDIRTTFKNDLVEYSTEFRNVCLNSGIDVDSEQLQIAIALSLSLKQQENEQEVTCSPKSDQSQYCASRESKIRATLLEYGFTVPDIKNQKKGKKRKRQSIRDSKVINITPQQKRQIVQNKVSEILFNFNSNIDHKLEKKFCTKSRIINLNNECYDVLKNDETFYTGNVVEVTPNTMGCLLKDWSKIPGRSISPQLDISDNRYFKEYIINQDDLDTLLSGTMHVVKRLVDTLKRENCCGNKNYSAEEICSKIKNDLQECTSEDLVSPIKHTPKCISPDLFDDEPCMSIPNDPAGYVSSKKDIASQSPQLSKNMHDSVVDLTDYASTSESCNANNNMKDKHNVAPLQGLQSIDQNIINSEMTDLTQSSNSSEESLPYVNLLSKKVNDEIIDITHFDYGEDDEVCRINFPESNTNERIGFDFRDSEDFAKSFLQTKNLSETSQGCNDKAIETYGKHSSIEHNSTQKILSPFNWNEQCVTENYISTKKSISYSLNKSTEFYNLQSTTNAEENNHVHCRKESIHESPSKVLDESNKLVNHKPDSPQSSNYDLYSESKNIDSDSKIDKIDLTLSTNEHDKSRKSDSDKILNHYSENDIEESDLTQCDNIPIENGESFTINTKNNDTIVDLDMSKINDDITVEYSNYSNVDPSIIKNCIKTSERNIMLPATLNNKSVNDSNNDPVNKFAENLRFDDEIISQCPTSVFNVSDEELDYSMHYYQKAKRKSVIQNSIAEIVSQDLNSPSTSKCFTPKSILRRTKSLNFDGSLPSVEIKGTKVKIRSPPAKSSPSTPVKSSKADFSMIVTPGNSEYLVKYNDVTPIQNFSVMDTPDVNKELDKYGIKPLKRKRAIQLLEHIYYQTHPVMEAVESDVENSPKKMKYQEEAERDCSDDDKENSKETEGAENIYEASNMEPVIRNIAYEEGDLIFQKREKAKVYGCRVPLHIAFHNYVHARPLLLESILRYEPVQIDLIHKQLAKEGHRYDPKDLLRFLDRKCITVKTADNEKRPSDRTKKRH